MLTHVVLLTNAQMYTWRLSRPGVQKYIVQKIRKLIHKYTEQKYKGLYMVYGITASGEQVNIRLY